MDKCHSRLHIIFWIIKHVAFDTIAILADVNVPPSTLIRFVMHFISKDLMKRNFISRHLMGEMIMKN